MRYATSFHQIFMRRFEQDSKKLAVSLLFDIMFLFMSGHSRIASS